VITVQAVLSNAVARHAPFIADSTGAPLLLNIEDVDFEEVVTFTVPVPSAPNSNPVAIFPEHKSKPVSSDSAGIGDDFLTGNGTAGATPETGNADPWGQEPSAGVRQAEAKEEEPERRLCGGCHKFKEREDFLAHEWQKEDAWSREAARQCQECALTRAQPLAGGDEQVRRAPKRAAAGRAQRWEREGSSWECEGRQLEQVLCPPACKCGNALAASGSPEVQVVQGGGVELVAQGVMAIENIEQGAIIICFGNSASVREGPAGDELQSLMNKLEEGESEDASTRVRITSRPIRGSDR
jgi:hypothetical protein